MATRGALSWPAPGGRYIPEFQLGLLAGAASTMVGAGV
jgi:hypothetical protein